MAVDDHLQIDVRTAQDRVVFELGGELDLAGAPRLQREIDNAAIEDAQLIVLDLRDLRFIDSSGLRVIIAAHKRSSERGQGFALTRGSQQVERLLQIAGVSEYLPTIASPDAMPGQSPNGSQAG